MTDTRALEQAGTNAVKRLRISKLKHGNPFMINTKELPSGQCYLEYPDGKIVLAALASESRDFTTLRELTDEESSALRLRLGLEYVSL